MADIKLTTCVFLVLAMLASVMEATPIRNALTLYSELVNATHRLRIMEEKLLNDFKADRLPNISEITPVDVPNLRLSENMTLLFRMTADENQLLTTHRDYFMKYNIIMNYLLEDEKNRTSSTSFESDITEISSFLSITILNKLKNVMELRGIPVTPEDISEQDAPYFTPKWERSVYQRRVRDCYVLEQLNEHLIKAENDFTTLRDRAE